MNREIKFRAWAGDKMLYNVGSDAYGNPMIWEKNVDVGPVNMDMWVAYEGEVQQFTGLLDQNGKEIYEGDILSNRNNCTGEVFFVSGGFKCRMFYDNGQEITFDLINVSKVTTIVGNAFENPELTQNGIVSTSKPAGK